MQTTQADPTALLRRKVSALDHRATVYLAAGDTPRALRCWRAADRLILRRLRRPA